MRDVIVQLFPRLAESEFEITSPADARYNCVAWAAGEVQRWWWPSEPPFSWWPAGVSREETVESFVEAFATLGYETALSGDPDGEWEKVAIFVHEHVPTHMARQMDDGSWTSKLGSLVDIRHVDIDAVSGTEYGTVVTFLRRSKISTRR